MTFLKTQQWEANQILLDLQRFPTQRLVCFQRVRATYLVPPKIHDCSQDAFDGSNVLPMVQQQPWHTPGLTPVSHLP